MAQPTAPITFPDPKEIKTAVVSPLRSAGGYFKPSNRSPQGPQPRIFHHPWLSVKLTFPSVLPRAFQETPNRVQATQDSPPPRPPRPLPRRPRAALPQPGTSARFPRWGRRGGEEASPRSSSPARTAAARRRRGAEGMLSPRAIFTKPVSLSKRVLASNNTVFKGGGKKRPKH